MAGRQGVFVGTPLDVAESSLLSRKQPLTSRAPRVWEQIVTDERGRRRLHGAFTGGFSAGYFNTVDTKEGFVPKTFRTSRSQRAEGTTQAVQDFYDKDELEEFGKVDVTTQDAYDTFGSSRTERVRERTEREAQARPIIPGEVISEFVEGVSDSIGVQLMQKMGWRQGKGIGEVFQPSAEGKWGPEASLAQQRSHAWNEKPKMNVQGLGFDPFRGSSAFERHKTGREATRPSSKRSRGIAFGVGVLEETDTFGEIGDYVEASHDHRINYYDMSDQSDDGKETRHTKKEPKRIGQKATSLKESFFQGFHSGTVLHEMKAFQLPTVPAHFTGQHVGNVEGNANQTSKPSHLSIPAPKLPADENLKRKIDSLAVFVAKGGVMSEELLRQEHQGDDTFSFLFGGGGSEYYRWKVLDVKVTFQKLGVHCIGLREAPLTADDRGFILGDERIKETQTKSRAVSHPFIQGVPEADRSRVKSALNSTFVKGSSETTLHEEETVCGLRAPKPKEEEKTESEEPSEKAPQPAELKPVRSSIDWHPVPLLYKRFNILDPLKGLPREAEPQSKFMSYESALDEVKTEDATAVNAAPTTSIADEVDITLPPPEYTEPPLDIFKSIFDASDEEEEKEETPEEVPEEKSVEIKPEPEPTQTPPSNREASQERSPVQRKRLNLSSDESEAEEEKPRKKDRKKKRTNAKEEQIDEELFKGLSTSEFKKLLKTLKKGRTKKKAKKAAKRERRHQQDKGRRRGKSDD